MSNEKVSIIIPTYNEEKNIIRCLNSIAKQTYNHSAIKIIIADGNSSDNTIGLINKWNKKNDIRIDIEINEKRVAEFGKSIGIKKAKGEYIVMLDADNEIVQNDWLKKFINAFEVYPDIFGVESNYLKIPNWNAVSNLLTYCQHIDDPLARDIAIKPKQVEVKKVDDLTYRKFSIKPGYPAGANGFMFRMSAVKDFVGKETFEEGQVLLNIALKGNAYHCMIDGYGIYHYFFNSFGKFLKKRFKRALKHSTRMKEKRKTWVNYTGMRMYLYAFLHLTFVYPFFFSIFKAIQEKKLLWLLYAPIAFVTTFMYLLSWVLIKITGKKAW